MKKPSFDVLIKKYFKFLELDYKFHFVKSKKESWGYEILYLNETTGVKIVYEYRKAYIFIFLYRLIDGKLIEDPGEIVQNTKLNNFSLGDIVNIRNPLLHLNPHILTLKILNTLIKKKDGGCMFQILRKI